METDVHGEVKRMNAEIEGIRQLTEKFLTEILEEEYRGNAGIADQINTKAVFEKYSQLGKRETFNGVREYSFRVTDDGEKRQTKYLLEFSANFLEGCASSDLRDQITNSEASEILHFDGKDIPFHRAGVLLRNLEERRKRHELDHLLNAVAEKTNPLYQRFWELSHQVVKELGYSSYKHYCEDLSGLDYTWLAQVTADILRHTEELYRDNLKYYAKEVVGVPMKELKKHDLLFIMRATTYDRFFEKDRLLSCVESWTKELGVDMTAGGNITFDLETRDKKNPRAFCCPIEVPNRVVLSIMPQGGVQDYQAFLHELGHALHFGYTPKDMPMEYRYLGDNAVTEGFAFLNEHLTKNTNWVKRYLGDADYSEYIRFAYFSELFMVRRYCAKLAYELRLHDGSPIKKELADIYTELLGKAGLCEYPRQNYLRDVDQDFYVARYLRAWLFESQMADYLREKFDQDWFCNPQAGKALVEKLWGSGQRLSADEMAKEMGYQGLSADSLLNTIEKALG